MLGIIGSGNVGSALGRALSDKGFSVLFYDVKPSQLAQLREEGYRTSLEFKDLLDCEALFVAVPIESLPNGNCDLSILKSVVAELSGFQGWVVQVSTCPPGTARKMLFRKYVVCPSFYNMSRMMYDALHPVKLLLGSEDGRPVPEIADIYANFDGPMFWSTWEACELAKYADNGLSALLISYWNEIHMLAEKLGVSSDWVARTVDTNPMYRSVYRFHGQAYGGPCLPKDTVALRNYAAETFNFSSRILDAAISTNRVMQLSHGVNQKHYFQAVDT